MAQHEWNKKLNDDRGERKRSYRDYTPESVDFIKSQPIDNVECRYMRHTYERVSTAVLYGQMKGCQVWVYLCGRCGTQRVDFLTPHRGLVFYRKYLYEDGYLFRRAKDVGGIDRELLSLAISERTDSSKPLTEDVHEIIRYLEDRL